MPSQFIHFSCYGAQAGGRRKPHENASDIIDEAARAPGAAGHVPRPQPPVQLYGLPLQTLKERMEEFANIARDRRGARLRRDGTILYAIVVSYPAAWRKMDGEDALSLYGRWREAVLDWLAVTFGDKLQSVVEHVDEAQPHLHAFVIPPLCPRNRIDHRLHPGHAAREAALGNGETRLAGERAYREGMRRWQDDFHDSVSSQFDHDRTGPRRRRFQRDIALARQASDRLLECMQSVLEHLVERLEPYPSLLMSSEAAEIETMADLVRGARQRLLSGRADALENLEAALTRMADKGDTVSSAGVNDFASGPDLARPAWDRNLADDDPDPEAAPDFDPEDDPDPERLEDDDYDEDWDDDPNDDSNDDPMIDHHYQEDHDPDR